MQGKLRAAMVTDVGGIGDESFNASAWRGLQRRDERAYASLSANVEITPLRIPDTLREERNFSISPRPVMGQHIVDSWQALTRPV